jgi:hypothetical protein
MEDSMGFVVLFGGAVLLCAVFFYFAVYVVPAYVGLEVFIWALSSGAGLGSPFAGLAAGVAVFLGGCFALRSRHAWLRLLALAVYVVPACLAGYGMVMEVGARVIPSPIWCQLFAIIFGMVVGATTFKSLMGPLPQWAARR